MRIIRVSETLGDETPPEESPREEKNLESKDHLHNFVEDWKAKGLSVFVFESGNYWDLSEVAVPKDQRSGGVGTEFMMGLVNLADTFGKTITLTPDISFGASSVGRLKRFYKRFGFVENKGRNKDFSFQARMYRVPK